MAFTQAQVDALKDAIAAAGIDQEVEYADGSRVKRMTPAQARDLLAMMEADVKATAPSAPIRRIIVTTCKGIW
ncbi:MAG: hypothetical protein J0H82_06215 [Alphaproteobacteria bacterium]|jgi:hypothetical protein|nr:hypothetical protein [Alphaproteobacteria bacterium]